MQEKDFNPSDFTLDDKELINEFDKVKLTPEFVKQFAYNLLLAKYYLDNYMVHHINGEDKAIENPWKLQYYCKKGKSAYMADLIDNDKSKQRELVHLLSMFEVAFTAKQRKNYLFYCLLHLFQDWNEDNYLKFVRNLADKYFFDVYLDANKLNERNQPKPNSFDETIIRNGKQSVELEMWIIPSMMSIPKVQAIYLSLYSTIPTIDCGRNTQKNCEETEPRKVQKLELNSLPPWDAATLALIHLTISISLELAKALSITILRQKLAKISLSHQKR